MRPAFFATVAAGLSLVGAALALPSATAPTISTVAGTGVGAAGPGVDGGLSTETPVDHPRGLAVSALGELLIAEPFRHTVRRVGADGRLARVAGTGEIGYSGDGGPAVAARLAGVHAVSLSARGGFLLADTGNHRIRWVAADGTITTVAGTGVGSYSGDGGPATEARIEAPRSVAALADGGFLIPDTGNDRIRRVSPDGTITTVAGNGVRGYSGDGGPATQAALNLPFDVEPVPGGGFVIADGNRIRRVDAAGRITTIAGGTEAGLAGDGGPARGALLSSPHAVAPLPDGGVLIADTGNNRVRRVWPDGTITTVAGTGQAGFGGDGGSPSAALLNLPKDVVPLPSREGYLIADAAGNRVRAVATELALPLVVRLPKNVRSKAGRPAVVEVLLSDAAALKLDALRSGKVVASVRAAKGKGESRLLLGRALRAGTYVLRLGATASGRRSATATGSLIVRR